MEERSQFAIGEFVEVPMTDDACVAQVWEAFPNKLTDLLPAVLNDGMVTTWVIKTGLLRGAMGVNQLD